MVWQPNILNNCYELSGGYAPPRTGSLPLYPAGGLPFPRPPVPPHLQILATPLHVVATAKKGSPYSITERRVPELLPVLGSQLAGNVSHKPGDRLPLLSARPAVTLATLKRAATNLAVWCTEARWV